MLSDIKNRITTIVKTEINKPSAKLIEIFLINVKVEVFPIPEIRFLIP